MDKPGLLQKILNSSGQIQKVFFKTSNGKILSKSEPEYDCQVICMQRGSLHGILLENIDTNLYTGYDLKSISNKEEGRVELFFGNGEMKVFDAVIGTDGLHSVVRKFILDDGLPVFRGYNIWRGIVKTVDDYTMVEKYIQFVLPLPIKFIVQNIFKKQHKQLFKKIELVYRFNLK